MGVSESNNLVKCAVLLYLSIDTKPEGNKRSSLNAVFDPVHCGGNLFLGGGCG